MGAAFVALGEALIDAVAVRLIGNDENSGLGRRVRCGEEKDAGQKRWEGSHDAPMHERSDPIR
jgi:hypothetical protein